MPLPHPGEVDVVDAPAVPWWKTSVVYQVYIRSFADGNGDGIGDIAGLRARLPYLAALGVDALWINPWYPSPQEDAGYDVADYRDIDPLFGTLADAEAFISEAHDAGLRVILDIVPNHTSSEHAWFQAALRGDAAARSRYVFRAGKGPDGDEPPNDWEGAFGGRAWTRVTNASGQPGDWYLHLFAPGQPDLDWTNPEVRDEFESILRFWFDRDVDGFRIDVAHGLMKAPGLPDAGDDHPGLMESGSHPSWDQDEVHEIYRDWRTVADSYDPQRIFVAEAWVPSNERLALYVRPDELHTAFQFDFLQAPFRADMMRSVIDAALATSASVDGVSTWVLSNHDVVRHVTRYARSQPAGLVDSDWSRETWQREEADLDLGVRRARAAVLLTLALPGTAYLYQGEELGLAEVEDIPGELRRDPVWKHSGETNPGRDGCRVPLPWSGESVPFGFSPEGTTAEPWLPQPASWASQTAELQAEEPASVLSLYAEALRLRTEHFGELSEITWIDAPPGTLAFRRGAVECWVNTSRSDVPMPASQVILASASDAARNTLAPDSAAWLAVA